MLNASRLMCSRNGSMVFSRLFFLVFVSPFAFSCGPCGRPWPAATSYDPIGPKQPMLCRCLPLQSPCCVDNTCIATIKNAENAASPVGKNITSGASRRGVYGLLRDRHPSTQPPPLIPPTNSLATTNNHTHTSNTHEHLLRGPPSQGICRVECRMLCKVAFFFFLPLEVRLTYYHWSAGNIPGFLCYSKNNTQNMHTSPPPVLNAHHPCPSRTRSRRSRLASCHARGPSTAVWAW